MTRTRSLTNIPLSPLALRVRDQPREVVEQVAGVVRTRRGLRMVLHRVRGPVEAPDALERPVVEVEVCELDAAVSRVPDPVLRPGRREHLPRLAAVGRIQTRLHREAVV